MEITRIYIEVLDSPQIRFDCVEEMHPLVQLKKQEGLLSQEQLTQVNWKLEQALGTSPNMLEEYCLFEHLAGLCSGLLVKWQLTGLSRFPYRTNPHSFYSPSSSTEALLTMDTFWLSRAVKEPPFHLNEDNELLALSKRLQVCTIEAFTCVLSVNSGETSAASQPLHMPSGLWRLCRKCPRPLAQLRTALVDLEAHYHAFEKKLVSVLSEPQSLHQELA